MPVKQRNIPKLVGPPGGEVMTCSFTTSGSTADVTTNEAQGCSVARTGVGTFVVTVDRAYKKLIVGMSVLGASTAQLFVKTAQTAQTITLTQVTAGGGTAVDTLVATIDLVIVGRTAS